MPIQKPNLCWARRFGAFAQPTLRSCFRCGLGKAKRAQQVLITSHATFVTRLLLFSLRHPWVVSLLLALVTGAALLQLGDLRLSVRSQAMMVQDSSEQQFHRHVMERFGSESTVIVLPADPLPFHPEKLVAIHTAQKDLDQEGYEGLR